MWVLVKSADIPHSQGGDDLGLLVLKGSLTATIFIISHSQKDADNNLHGNTTEVVTKSYK